MAYNPELPLARSVFHPSDLSEASHSAFAHALAIALLGESRLTILHAGGGPWDWADFPAIRQTLTDWGALESGAPRSAVHEQLGLRVKKVTAKESDPLEAITGFLRTDAHDFLVLATRGRKGLPAWLEPSVAEAVSRQASVPTLFVPEECRGFIGLRDGRIKLRRILIPVAHDPAADPALRFVARIGQVMGEAEATLLWVGAETNAPEIDLPADETVTWVAESAEGDVAEAILARAEATQTDLIVMVTDGRNGFLDALRGSHTERVLREAWNPVLAIPDGWTSADMSDIEGALAGRPIADVAHETRSRARAERKAEFRALAKQVHPDLAEDEEDRARRGALMARLNAERDRSD